MHEGLKKFAERLGLELESSSPITSCSYLNVARVGFDEILRFNWPATRHIGPYDRVIYIGLYNDGSFTVLEKTDRDTLLRDCRS